MSSCKYLIVGQGIAGSLMAMQCIQRKLSFIVIDQPVLSQASRVAAGIINPITGRKFVKTWMYETLEQSFLPTYAEFEKLLGSNYLSEKQIIRAIHKVADQNNWDAKAQSEEAAPYMNSGVDFAEYEGKVRKQYAYGTVNGYQLNIKKLITDFRAYLQTEKLINEEVFDHNNLEVSQLGITYNGVKAERIVFCEGHKVTQNPYFSYLPFAPAKGELFIVKIPGFRTKTILKDKIFICPVKDDLYWVGATYAWDEFTDHPSDTKKAWLLEALENVLAVPFEVVEHHAGVRPATKYRRPFIGTHPDYDNVHLFNGLGTKGSSLGPFWAEHFMDSLEEGKGLSREVDISKIKS